MITVFETNTEKKKKICLYHVIAVVVSLCSVTVILINGVPKTQICAAGLCGADFFFLPPPPRRSSVFLHLPEHCVDKVVLTFLPFSATDVVGRILVSLNLVTVQGFLSLDLHQAEKAESTTSF